MTKPPAYWGWAIPGGPAIDKEAVKGSPDIELPRSWLKGTSDFSFSGIKTALLRMVEKDRGIDIADAAASFQQAVVDVLVKKTVSAARQHCVKQILLSGGVAANRKLRQKLAEDSPIPVLIPKPILCTDNAAMVAACGYFRLARGETGGLDMDVIPGLKLT